MVRLISVTPDLEKIIGYCTRVSNPKNQDNYETVPKLLSYCIKNGHWSPFEMGNMLVEITTGRDISPQILRHKSFSFQEFSFRYSEALEYIPREARSQDLKNRQASHSDVSDELKEEFRQTQEDLWRDSYKAYRYYLDNGIAKECARAILPLNTKTTLYMNGTVRSWIHYCLLRCDKATQLEHREIANKCYLILKENAPNVCEALESLNPWLKEIK